MKFDIGFVAHAHVCRKAFLAFQFCFGDEREGHITALGEKADVSFGGIPQAHQIQSHVHIDHAGCIGANNTDTELLSDGDGFFSVSVEPGRYYLSKHEIWMSKTVIVSMEKSGRFENVEPGERVNANLVVDVD